MAQFLADNMLLVGLMLASGAMFAWPTFSGMASGVRQLSTLDATRIMNSGEAVVVDVRESSDFASGRIPKSKNLPIKDLAKRIGELERFKNKPVIVSCGTGTRASGATRLFKSAGFSDVYILKGGLAAWRDASLPVEK